MIEKKTNVYLFSYYHDKSWWALEIPGYSEQDALERLKKLPLARYDGVLGGTIYVNSENKILIRMMKYLSNFFIGFLNLFNKNYINIPNDSNNLQNRREKADEKNER